MSAHKRSLLNGSTPKSDYRERTGTEWLALGSGSGSGLGFGLVVSG